MMMYLKLIIKLGWISEEDLSIRGISVKNSIVDRIL